MSNALDQKETEFALKVRRALDENINSLPAASLDKLAAARQTAIARKKPEKSPSRHRFSRLRSPARVRPAPWAPPDLAMRVNVAASRASRSRGRCSRS